MAAPVLTSNSPSAGYITWTASRLVYAGNDYPIPAGNTNKRFVYWSLSGSTPGVNGTGGVSNIQYVDTLPDPFLPDDFILFLNKSGVAVNATQASVIDGSLIVTGSILSDAIGANQIVAGKIATDAVDAAQIKSNAVTSVKIQAGAVNANHIAAGSIGTNQLSVGAYTSNLAPNPYFEDWDVANPMPDGWSQLTGTGYTGTITRETGTTISGVVSMGMTAAASNQAGVYMTRAVPCTSSEDIYFGAYYACATALAQGMLAAVYFYDGAGQLLSSQSSNEDITGNLTVDQIQHVAQSPVGAKYMQAVLITNSTAKVYVDNVEMGYRVTTVKIADGAITAEKIKTGEVWAGTMPIGNLTTGGTGGTVALGSTQLTATGTTGGFVKLSNAGVELFDSTSNRVVNLPTDISDTNPATFRGNIDAQGLTSSKTASFSGTTRLEQGSTTYIGLSTQPPSITPVTLIDWPSTPFTGYDFTGKSVVGLQWDSAASQWIVSTYYVDEGNGNKLTTQVARFNASGVYQATSFTLTYANTQQGGGAVYLNGRYYFAYTDQNLAGSEGYHRIYCTNTADIAHNKRIAGRDNTNPPTLFTDGTDLYHVDQDPTLTNRPFIVKIASGDTPLAAGPDVMVNGQFETDTSGWAAQAGGQSLAAVAPSFGASAGTKSLQISADGVNTSAGANRQGIPVTPGTYYTVTAKVRPAAANALASRAYMYVHDESASGADANASESFGGAGASTGVLSTSAWTTMTMSGYTHRDATQLYVAFNFVLDNAGVVPNTYKYYVDDVQVHTTAGFNPTGFYTGSPTTGVTWSTGAQLSGGAVAADGGTSRFWIGPPRGLSAGQITAYSMLSGATWQTDDTFPGVDAGTCAFTWNGTNFYSMDNNGVLYTHTGMKWPASDTSTWWVGNTYQDTVAPAAETSLGPLRSLTMKKRARLTITAPDLTGVGSDTEPNTAGHYVVRSATAPAWNQIYYQGNTMPVSPSTKSIYTITTLPSTTTTDSITGLTTAPNPASNPVAFPIGTAAKIVSSEIGSNQLIQLNGDGAGRVGPLSWDNTGKILTVPDGNPLATVLLFAGAWNQVPTNYLICDGSAYSVPIANGGTTDAYAALYAVIGFTYGGGSGVFNVPDMRLRFPLGSDKNSAAAGTKDPGSSDGQAVGSRSVSHTHTTTDHQHTMMDHTHGGTSHTHTVGGLAISSAADRATGTGNRGANPVTGNTGGHAAGWNTAGAQWTNGSATTGAISGIGNTTDPTAPTHLTMTYIIKYRNL